MMMRNTNRKIGISQVKYTFNSAMLLLGFSIKEDIDCDTTEINMITSV
jgi:hypothetical protein